jgi:RNA polymerase sigma-70 factor (ECF subfamily)
MSEIPLDLEALHRMRRPAWVRWAERFLRHRADAEEAVDDAVEQIFDAWDDILGKENPQGYCWTIVRNTVTDHARQRGRRPTLLDDAAFDALALRTALDPIAQLPDVMLVISAIENLAKTSPRQHDVFVLLACEGYSVAKVADILGITQATVRSTERHAIRQLRAVLNAHMREGETP